MSSNEVTTTKVEEPVQVTRKDPKKIAAGKRLAEWGRKNREKLAQEAKAKENKSNLSYGIGAVIVIRVLGLLGYYIFKKGDNNAPKVTSVKTQK